MTPSRRSILKSAFAVGTGAWLAPRMLYADQPGPVAGGAPAAVIYDERFAAARAFAAETRRRQIETLAYRDDVHELWATRLDGLWRSGRSVAGIGTFRALFPLQLMAQDAGLRVVHRVHHEQDARRHAVFGPLSLRDGIQSRLALAGPQWAREAGALVAAWPCAGMPVASDRSDIRRAAERGVSQDVLISWLIATPAHA